MAELAPGFYGLYRLLDELRVLRPFRSKTCAHISRENRALDVDLVRKGKPSRGCRSVYVEIQDTVSHMSKPPFPRTEKRHPEKLMHRLPSGLKGRIGARAWHLATTLDTLCEPHMASSFGSPTRS